MKPKIKRTITRSSAKAKGREFQKEIAKRFSSLLNIAWGRDEQIAPREMGQNGTDIRFVAEAKRAAPWSVECKRRENINLFQFVRHARANKMENTDWVLFVKRSREDGVAIIDIDVFFDLLSLISGTVKGRIGNENTKNS